MNTTETTKTTKTVNPIIKAKAETFRVYGYTNKTNNNWIEKNSKTFGSKAKFIDALITAARKNKLEIKAPSIKSVKKVAATKTVKRSKKLQ